MTVNLVFENCGTWEDATKRIAEAVAVKEQKPPEAVAVKKRKPPKPPREKIEALIECIQEHLDIGLWERLYFNFSRAEMKTILGALKKEVED